MAASPPSVRWPGGARVAVSFVVNFEEGAELSVSDGDERNEGAYEAVEEVEGYSRPLPGFALRIWDPGGLAADRGDVLPRVARPPR